MIAVVKCYKHITPVIVTVFEKNDEQTHLSRKDNCEYRVMVEYWVAFGTSAK